MPSANDLSLKKGNAGGRSLYRAVDVRAWSRSKTTFLSSSYVRVPRTVKTAPQGLGEIDAFLSAVEAAQWIVQLGENWDEEGSPGYSPNTLERAASFLLDHARASVERFGHCFAPPEIVPADAGSIDLHWQQGPMHLLVNVPEPPDEKITFYGEDDVRGTISGQIGIGVTRLDVAAWLL